MIEIVFQFVCAFLIAMSVLFIVVELRARFERSFLIFGITNLLLLTFCAIDIWFERDVAQLQWEIVQHIIVAFVPGFMFWYLMLVLNRINRWALRGLFFLGAGFSLLFLSNTMLRPVPGDVLSTALYNFTFVPYMTGYIIGIAIYLIVNFFKSKGKEKQVLQFHLIGFAAVGTGGIVDMMKVVFGNRFAHQIPNCSTPGLLVYGLVATGVFADRLSTIIKDREKAFLKLQEAYHELEFARPLARLGQSVAMVSHEIKNKTFSISLKLNSLRRVETGAATLEKIEHCSEAVKAIASFSHDVLTQSGISVNLKDRVDVRDFVKDLTSSRLFPENIFRWSGIEGELAVLGDMVKLQSAFENLFLNSVQAGATSIEIRARKRKGVLVIAIEDNGIGCDSKTFDSLFTPFFTTKKSLHGTGLGLVIAQTIFENHGGSLSAYSKNALNNGSSGLLFTVVLPEYGAEPWTDVSDQPVLVLEDGQREPGITIGRILRSVHIPYRMVLRDDVKEMKLSRQTRIICRESMPEPAGNPNAVFIKPLLSMVAVTERGKGVTTFFTEETAVALAANGRVP